jgi:hypothetical protein
VSSDAAVAQSFDAEVQGALDDLKRKAQFSEVGVLNDWFRRHQAQGEYQAKYGGAYRVYEIHVDDYRDELLAVSRWLSSVQDAWNRVKGPQAIAPLI